MEDELINIKSAAVSLILEANDERELAEIKLGFLGRSGKLTSFTKKLARVPKSSRPEIGKLVNEVKATIEETLKSQEARIKSQELGQRQATIDKTAPGIPPKIGHLHAITHVLNDVISIFQGLGYHVADGPDIESDYYNFAVLNFLKDHPARDTQQTFFLDTRGSKVPPGEVILRTHTSGMQGRVMEKCKPPLRVIVPGKVFRHEQVDASHGFEFWQVEGFAVDTYITFTDLLGTIEHFFKKLYGNDTKVRFAAHNFPFTEPSLEAFVSCAVCKGKGCTFCKKSGWVEMLGAGMIHPNVLNALHIDPKEWQGFAFGMGLSRMVTLRYQMDDLRLLTNPDLRILEQF